MPQFIYQPSRVVDNIAHSFAEEDFRWVSICIYSRIRKVVREKILEPKCSILVLPRRRRTPVQPMYRNQVHPHPILTVTLQRAIIEKLKSVALFSSGYWEEGRSWWWGLWGKFGRLG
jgi:hypothetical protein